ncbi:MAG TPA: hypothetical protein VFP08_05240, partial [Acidimicrobiales bacterium]|nr:hypothetical protein [Acidimicrobiales bacterium]
MSRTLPDATICGLRRPAVNHLSHLLRSKPAGGQRATKYLARGWWQMMAEVVCSGWYCQPVS